jgi:AraC family transcriptional regulator of adaptative response / DNA-3-methyladenine glycosylase II
MGKITRAHGIPTSGLEAFKLGFRFPEPDALVDAELPMPRQRAAAVRSFADAVASDRLALDGSLPLECFEDQLIALPGIGSWTAKYLALRLGYADAFPASDLGVMRALGAATETEATERAEGWRPWRAYATVRLWSH